MGRPGTHEEEKKKKKKKKKVYTCASGLEVVHTLKCVPVQNQPELLLIPRSVNFEIGTGFSTKVELGKEKSLEDIQSSYIENIQCLAILSIYIQMCIIVTTIYI